VFNVISHWNSIVGEVTVLALDQTGYNMVLAPVEDILKQNMERYKTYKQMLEEGSVRE
jgi:hypothetical protein